MSVLNQLLDLPGIQFDHVAIQPTQIALRASTTSSTAPCPSCGSVSSSVHSSYVRKLQDLPWGLRRLSLTLALRRFRCREAACPRQTFVERLSRIAPPYARTTNRLRGQQQQVALAAGGELGARLTQQLGLTTSPDTLIRLIRAAPLPPRPAVKIIGLDDWCKRKGQTYGTLIIDLETHRPLDVLPERTAEAVAAWLQQHPTVEVVTRDRADEYITGATTGAPQARQIADRWHLIKNLGDALQRLLDRQSADLRTTAQRLAAEQLATTLTPSAPAALPEPIPAPLPPSHRQHQYEEIARLHAEGWSVRRIGRTVGLDRRTVQRYLLAKGVPVRSAAPQNTSLAAKHLPEITALWTSGSLTYQAIWEELQKSGFRGSYASLRRLMKHLDPTSRRHGPRILNQPSTPVARPISAKRAMWLLLLPETRLKPEELRYREVLLEVCPAAVQGQQLAHAFLELVRERQVERLEPWLKEAEASGLKELRNFAQSLRRDEAAVRNALQEPWSNGPVEAHVHRLKFIKRSMYGRANFDLLRKRVLLQV